MSEEKKEQVEIQINVLIIAHKQNQFNSAAAFLTRRGFPCTVKGNIREGLQFITKNKASHVFLSWNLPGANIVKTYQLITQTFKVDCVAFAEKGDGKTAAELTMCKLPEVMQAPVSGPGLYMRVQKLIKQKLEGPEVTPEKKQAAINKQQNKSRKIVLKASNKDVPTDGQWESAGVDPKDGQPIYRFKSNNKNYNGPEYTYKGTKPPGLKEDGTWDDSNGTFRIESDLDNETNPSTVNFQKSEEGLDISEDSNDPSMNDISDLLNGMNDPASLDALNNSENDPFGNLVHHAEQMGLTTKSGNENQNSNSNFSDSDLNTNGENGYDPSSSQNKNWKSQRKEKSYGSVLNVAKKRNKNDEEDLPDYQRTQAKEALILELEPRIETLGTMSLLAEKTLEAVQSSTKQKPGPQVQIETLKEAKAYTIHSPRFRGYLLLTSSQEMITNEEFYQNIRDHLKILLEKAGETLLNLEELELDLQSFEFYHWAKENAEFVISSYHNGYEMMCAFVPTNQTLPVIKDSIDTKMLTVETEMILADTKSKFNLYFHLPKNNKFIRYLKPGDSFSMAHKDKFDKHNLKEIHIKKEESKQFKEYFAQNQIKQMTLQPSKKKAS